MPVHVADVDPPREIVADSVTVAPSCVVTVKVSDVLPDTSKSEDADTSRDSETSSVELCELLRGCDEVSVGGCDAERDEVGEFENVADPVGIRDEDTDSDMVSVHGGTRSSRNTIRSINRD